MKSIKENGVGGGRGRGKAQGKRITTRIRFLPENGLIEVITTATSPLLRHYSATSPGPTLPVPLFVSLRQGWFIWRLQNSGSVGNLRARLINAILSHCSFKFSFQLDVHISTFSSYPGAVEHFSISIFFCFCFCFFKSETWSSLFHSSFHSSLKLATFVWIYCLLFSHFFIASLFQCFAQLTPELRPRLNSSWRKMKQR